ncbi:hypothetical protein BH10CHL1_BH10CHL1_10660 [soil metagenome]
MNRQQQILLYLYSTPNIVGSALGLLGLLLYFTGIINAYWFLIVLGLYLVGVVVTPRNPVYDLHLRNQLSVEAVQTELENLVRSIQNKVPKDILDKVISIKASIVSILPTIVDVNSGDYNIYVIRQTALEYLPGALQNYLNLPPAYATLHPIRNGKTAQQLLSDQLDLLDQKMKEVVDDLHRNDTQKLLVHGRFLEEKFRKDDLLSTGSMPSAAPVNQ